MFFKNMTMIPSEHIYCMFNEYRVVIYDSRWKVQVVFQYLPWRQFIIVFGIPVEMHMYLPFCNTMVSLSKMLNISFHSKGCYPIYLLHASLVDSSNVDHYAPILYVALMVKAAQTWVLSFLLLPPRKMRRTDTLLCASELKTSLG